MWSKKSLAPHTRPSYRRSSSIPPPTSLSDLTTTRLLLHLLLHLRTRTHIHVNARLSHTYRREPSAFTYTLLRTFCNAKQSREVEGRKEERKGGGRKVHRSDVERGQRDEWWWVVDPIRVAPRRLSLSRFCVVCVVCVCVCGLGGWCWVAGRGLWWNE